MKKLFLFFCALSIAVGLQAQVIKTVNLTAAGSLSAALTADELSHVTDLTLTGDMNLPDFIVMRDMMPALVTVDLSGANVVASGSDESNSIPDFAFSSSGIGHGSLAVIKLPKNITSIGREAFENCSGLKTLTIPSSVTSIGDLAFAGCNGLSFIRVLNSTPVKLSVLSSESFLNVSQTIPVYVPKGSKVTYTASAEWGRFVNIIEVADDVVAVTAGALDTLLKTSLDTITTLKIVGTIDARDFKTMRDSMPLLESLDLSAATIVEYTGTNGTNGIISSVYQANTIPFSAFAKCENIITVVLPNSVTTIEENAFLACNQLRSIAIPASATKIKSMAFAGCGSLTEVNIPTVLTTIAAGTFYECSGLTSIIIPSAITSIEDKAFAQCNKIASIRSLCATPASLPSVDVFSGIDNTIPLYVPAGTKATYAAAEGWKYFTNIVEMGCSFNQKSLQLASAANSFAKLEVTSNTKWHIESPADWLHLSFTPTDFTTASTSVSYTQIYDTTLQLNVIADVNKVIKSRSTELHLTCDNGVDRYIVVMQSGTDIYITAPTATHVFARTDTASTVALGCNTDWTAMTLDGWLTVSPVSGSGDAKLTISADANTSLVPRIGTVYLSAGKTKKTIEVTQGGDTLMAIQATKTELVAQKDTFYIYVKANVEWNVTSAADWLTETIIDGKVQIVAQPNTSIKPRTASVMVFAGQTERTVEIAQVGDTVLVCSDSPLTFKPQCDSSLLKITSNTKWEVSCSEPWLSVHSISDSGSAEFYIVAEQNKVTAQRSATIRISAKGAKDIVIGVTQAESPLYITVPKTLEMTADGGETKIDVLSNMDWMAMTLVDWLSVDLSGASGDASLIITAEANSSKLSRTGTIAFSSGKTKQIITVTQLGYVEIIPPLLEVSALEVDLDAIGTPSTVTVASNLETTASSNAEWLQVSLSGDDFASASSVITFGSSTETTETALWFVAATNTTGVVRSSTVTLSAKGITKTVVVTQAANGIVIPDLLEVSSSDVELDAFGTPSNVLVASNLETTASSDAEWLQVSLSGEDFGSASSTITFGSATDITQTTVWFVAATNTTGAVRSATVTVTAGTMNKTITVTQMAEGKPIFRIWVSSKTATLNAHGAPQNIVVSSPLYTTASSDADWLHVSLSGEDFASASSTVSFEPGEEISVRALWFSAATNTTGAVRTATVIFTAEELEKIVTITQMAFDNTPAFIELSSLTANLTEDGAATSIAAMTNREVVASSDADWLHVSLSNEDFASASSTVNFGSPFAPTKTTLWIVASKNKTGVNRAATVSFSAEGISKTVLVEQKSYGDDPIPVTISFPSSTVSLHYRDTAVLFATTVNAPTVATSFADWLQVGLSGDDFASASSTVCFGSSTQTSTTDLWFIAATNTTGAARTAIVTFTIGDVTKPVIILQEKLDAQVKVSASVVKLDSVGTPNSVVVTSNLPTTASSNAEWLQVSLSGADFASASSTVAFGSASETTTTTLWFVAATNTTGVSRVGIVTVSANGVTQSVIVRQVANDGNQLPATLELSSSDIKLNHTDTVVMINATGNAPTFAASNADWLQVSLSGSDFTSASPTVIFGSATQTTTTALWFVAASNATSAPRTAVVVFAAGDILQTVTVTQRAALTDVVTVSTDSIAFGALEGKTAVSVQAISTWEVTTDASWLTIDLSQDGFIVSTSESNSSLNKRTANLYIVSEGRVVKIIPVTQEGSQPKLSVSIINYLASAEESSSSFTVTSNTQWTATTSADWISLQISGNVVSFTVKANAGTQARIAQIEVSASGVESKQVTIQQNETGAVPMVSAVSTVNVSANGGEIRVAVSANTTWGTLVAVDWIGITQTTNAGNGEMIITVNANPTRDTRTAKIALTGVGAIGQMITLTQEPGNSTEVAEPEIDTLSVYPNPASNFIHIAAEDAEGMLVSLISMNGTIVSQTDVSGGTAHFSIEGLARGIYQVQMQTNKKTVVKRVIVE